MTLATLAALLRRTQAALTAVERHLDATRQRLADLTTPPAHQPTDPAAAATDDAGLTVDPDTVVPVVWLPMDTPDGTILNPEPFGHLAGPVPMLVPNELLTAILFVETDPGDHAPNDVAGRWEAITQHILLAGVEQIVKRLAVIRHVAHANPDDFLWWESCREQVHHLFPPTGTGRPVGRDASTAD